MLNYKLHPVLRTETSSVLFFFRSSFKIFKLTLCKVFFPSNPETINVSKQQSKFTETEDKILNLILTYKLNYEPGVCSNLLYTGYR